jgi:hypothetical protein
VLLLLWILAGVLGGRRRGERPDRTLLLAALLLVAASLLLPEKQGMTIRLASRWLPSGLALAVLAVPIPQLDARLLRAATVAVLTLTSAATTLAWRTVALTDLAGLRESLLALPAEPRLLGLNFLRQSAVLRGDPYYNLFAWSQVLHGGDLNSTFAALPSSLVVRSGPLPPWTPDLEFFSSRVQRSDLGWFDYVLVSGAPPSQAPFLGEPLLEPVTTEGMWRLYRVRHAAARATAAPRPGP